MYKLVPFAVETTLSYLHRVPALECQRETDVRTVKPSSAALSFGEVALFRIFGKATFDSEDPKTHQVAQWRWRFFGSRGKKTNRGLRFERFYTERRFDEAPQVR